MTCLKSGLELSNRWYGVDIAPEPLKRMLRANPKRAVIPCFLAGGAKALFFPVIALVGVVVQPFFAAYHGLVGRDSERGANWAKAWGFSLLALGGFIAYMHLSSTYLPLGASAALYIAAIGVSGSICVLQNFRAAERAHDE